MSFYVTLPSNASMDFFPQNVVSNYTTKLINPLRFDGPWVVALSKISFKNSIISSVGTMIFSHKHDKFTFDLVINESEKVDTFLEGLVKRKTGIEAVADIKISDDKNIVIIPHVGFEMRIYGALPFILNIEPGAKYTFANPLKVPKSDRKIQKVDTIFIYTDIIEEQYVGDSKAQLLDTISINGEMDAMITIDISNPNYVNLAKTEISTINIVLKDNTGENIHFSNLAKVVLKFHFKPKKYE
jgi:hypothetical protein